MANMPTCDNAGKTPLAMADKALFIHHINEEHQDELVMLINAFTKAAVHDHDITSLKEVYTDGILLDVITTNPNQNHFNTVTDGCHAVNSISNETSGYHNQYFINFTQPICDAATLHEQYIALLQSSATKLGKRTIKLQDQYFTVIHGHYASPNMYRLTVIAPDNTPLNHPGYAYLFELNADISSAISSAIDNNPENNHQSLQRYYTLRKAWQDPSSLTVQAWIDVYIHGDTSGGDWARDLDCGMQIKTVREYPEKTDHLADGQCLLICDETSLPTVANLLENWQNSLPPIVIAVLNDPKDISYLYNLTLSHALIAEAEFLQDYLLSIVKTPAINVTEQIVALLDNRVATLPAKIDRVWGALEAADIKSLRQSLKTTLGLSRQDMILKVYWRAQ